MRDLIERAFAAGVLPWFEPPLRWVWLAVAAATTLAGEAARWLGSRPGRTAPRLLVFASILGAVAMLGGVISAAVAALTLGEGLPGWLRIGCRILLEVLAAASALPTVSGLATLLFGGVPAFVEAPPADPVPLRITFWLPLILALGLLYALALLLVYGLAWLIA